jgi:hypothetical protein
VNKIGHGSLPIHIIIHIYLNLTKLALHELDPVFRNVTLENDRLKALARDLRFHHDPVGEEQI